jgi:hypothetical protein
MNPSRGRFVYTLSTARKNLTDSPTELHEEQTIFSDFD